jgi:formylglycine-generating enzyme required for sulfatase activity
VFSTSFTEAGVADVAGNVWEWCCNALPGDASAGYGSDAQQAAAGAGWDPADDSSPRALRGGAFRGTTDDCRPAYRNRSTPGDDNGNVGVRLVRCWLPHS